MKKLIFAIVLTIGAVVAAANRTRTDVEASIVITRVILDKLIDGGCAVQASASYTRTDGGNLSEDSPQTEVAGANRTTCLDIMDNKAILLFKQTNGF